MSIWDKVQNVMVQQPEVYKAIFVEGARSEQKYQERVKQQEQTYARLGKPIVKGKDYVPFP